MKSSIRSLAVIGVVAVMAVAVVVAEEPNASVRQRVERMRQGLGLSDEQATKIEAILNDAVKQREALRAEGVAATPRGTAMRQQVRNQINALLTPEQRVKRDEIVAERNRGQRERRPGGRRA
jgi:hypothetical protein